MSASHSIERRSNGWALVREEASKKPKTLRIFKTEQGASAALNLAVFGGIA